MYAFDFVTVRTTKHYNSVIDGTVLHSNVILKNILFFKLQGNRRGCFSQVGFQGGFQALNLNSRHPVGRGCFRHGTVVHELLHALGFYHMQSSPDRDDYVNIVWDNILKCKLSICFIYHIFFSKQQANVTDPHLT